MSTRITVRYKLTQEETEYVDSFCRQLQLPLEIVARKALLMTIGNYYRAAAERTNGTPHNAAQAGSPGNTAGSPVPNTSSGVEGTSEDPAPPAGQ